MQQEKVGQMPCCERGHAAIRRNALVARTHPPLESLQIAPARHACTAAADARSGKSPKGIWMPECASCTSEQIAGLQTPLISRPAPCSRQRYLLLNKSIYETLSCSTLQIIEHSLQMPNEDVCQRPAAHSTYRGHTGTLQSYAHSQQSRLSLLNMGAAACGGQIRP